MSPICIKSRCVCTFSASLNWIANKNLMLKYSVQLLTEFPTLCLTIPFLSLYLLTLSFLYKCQLYIVQVMI